MNTLTKKLVSVAKFASLMIAGKDGMATVALEVNVSQNTTTAKLTVTVLGETFSVSGADEDVCFNDMLGEFRTRAGSAANFRAIFNRVGF